MRLDASSGLFCDRRPEAWQKNRWCYEQIGWSRSLHPEIRNVCTLKLALKHCCFYWTGLVSRAFFLQDVFHVAEAFWSIALIAVSAALINYNKYLMNPSRPVTVHSSLFAGVSDTVPKGTNEYFLYYECCTHTHTYIYIFECAKWPLFSALVHLYMSNVYLSVTLQIDLHEYSLRFPYPMVQLGSILGNVVLSGKIWLGMEVCN